MPMNHEVSFFSSIRGKMLMICLILSVFLMAGIGVFYRQACESPEVRNMLLVGMIFFGLAWAVVFLIVRNMTRRVDRLTRTALALHEGNLSARVNIVRRDEPGLLGKTFDTMAEHIGVLVGDLEESEKKYRSLFENSIVGIFQTSPDGRVINANPAQCDHRLQRDARRRRRGCGQ